MYKLKTRPTTSEVGNFLMSVENEVRRSDGEQIAGLMQEITGVSPHKQALTIYIMNYIRPPRCKAQASVAHRIGNLWRLNTGACVRIGFSATTRISHDARDRHIDSGAAWRGDSMGTGQRSNGSGHLGSIQL